MAAAWAAATTSSVSATCPRRSPASAARRVLRSSGGAVGCGGNAVGRCYLPTVHAGLSYAAQVPLKRAHSPAQEGWRRRGLRRQRVRSERIARADRRPPLLAGCRRSGPHRPAQGDGGAEGCGGYELGQCDLAAPSAGRSYVQGPPERATQSCSGAMAAPWARRHRVRGERPACAERRPQLRAVWCGALHTVLLRSNVGAVGGGDHDFGQGDLSVPTADVSYTGMPPVRATLSCSGTMAASRASATASSASATCPRRSPTSATCRELPEHATQSCSGAVAAPWAAAATLSVSATCLR